MRITPTFEALLDRERNRTNRNGLPFSLIVFSGHSLEDLQRRARDTDFAGHFDGERIGVLLPNTTLEQAFDFVTDFDHTDRVRYEIHSYPDYWSDDFSALGLPWWKRAMDVVVSVTFLLLLSPLLAAIGLFIKIISPGPVLYTSQRVGYRGRLFTFLKFRTMRHEPEDTETHVREHKEHLKDLIRHSDMPMPKLDKKDDRIFWGGGILRRSSLDELPQLVNILKGEMSFVGPRPCIPYEAEEYLQWHRRRFDTVPGLTGLWQVSGKNQLSFREMMRLDIAYCERISPLLDMKITLKTFPVVIGLFFATAGKRLMRSNEERRNRRNRRDRRADALAAERLLRRREDLAAQERARELRMIERRAEEDRREGERRRAAAEREAEQS